MNNSLDEQQAKTLGVGHCITKPLSLDALRVAISQSINHSAQ